MEMVDALMEILSTVIRICDAYMVPPWIESGFGIATIFAGQRLTHLPSSQNGKESSLPIPSPGRITHVGQNIRLHRIGNTVRIIRNELSRLLIMHLSQLGKTLLWRAQKI